MFHLEGAQSKLVQLKRITEGGLDNFCDFSAKNGHFCATGITFRIFLFERFERNEFVKFGSHFKGLNCLNAQPFQSPLQIKYKTRLNACILRSNVRSN